MLGEYLNQTIPYKAISSVDAYNEKTYTSSNIKGRFVYKREIVRNAENEQIMSVAILYTETAVEEGDVITYDSKNWVIKFVYPHNYFDGSVMGYKAVL